MIALTIEAADPNLEKILVFLGKSGIPPESQITLLKTAIEWLAMVDDSRLHTSFTNPHLESRHGNLLLVDDAEAGSKSGYRCTWCHECQRTECI